MKWIIVSAMVLLGSVCYGQDVLLTHNGEEIKCQVVEVLEKSIKYKHSGEEIVNTISKNMVGEIKFASGRVQKVSEKVIINGEDDWEKVQITSVESDVDGLVRKKELVSKSTAGSTLSNSAKVEKRAIDKLKKQAAAAGCHLILLNNTSKRTNVWGGNVGANASGFAYAYK